MESYINLSRLEFPVTFQCSGKCKHCSVGEKEKLCINKHIDMELAVQTIKDLSNLYRIDSVMTFGGEPLLYPDMVFAIHKTAREAGIGKRQLITNGYWSKSETKINEVALGLFDAGVNSILVSVDEFHQEYIPLDTVKYTIDAMQNAGLKNIKLSPAWLVSPNDNNQYNIRTREILNELVNFKIPIGTGNVVFPSGNARVHLANYFNIEDYSSQIPKKCSELPYTEELNKISTLSIEPNGNVMVCQGFSIGNVYEKDIESIVKNYNPYGEPFMSVILDKGIDGLIDLATEKGITVDKSDYFTICDICMDIRNRYNQN